MPIKRLLSRMKIISVICLVAVVITTACVNISPSQPQRETVVQFLTQINNAINSFNDTVNSSDNKARWDSMDPGQMIAACDSINQNISFCMQQVDALNPPSSIPDLGIIKNNLLQYFSAVYSAFGEARTAIHNGDIAGIQSAGEKLIQLGEGPALIQIEQVEMQLMASYNIASSEINARFAGPNPPPTTIAITTSSLDDGEVGIAYSQFIVIAGGTDPITGSIISGNLPSGLTLNPNTGEISGIPSIEGTSSFTLRVVDATGAWAEQTLSITIVPPPVITTSSLPAGKQGIPYSQTLQAVDGIPPYTWSISSGVLPPRLGLNSNTGVISGTPTTAEIKSNFEVMVTDGVGGTATKLLSITIVRTISFSVPESIDDATVGEYYRYSFSSAGNPAGGHPPYTFLLGTGGGFQPFGLSLDAGGLLSGIPEVEGARTFDVCVKDLDGNQICGTTHIMVNPAIEPPPVEGCVEIFGMSYGQPEILEGDSVRFGVKFINNCTEAQVVQVQCNIDGQFWDSGSVTVMPDEKTWWWINRSWPAALGTHTITFTTENDEITDTFTVVSE